MLDPFYSFVIFVILQEVFGPMFNMSFIVIEVKAAILVFTAEVIFKIKAVCLPMEGVRTCRCCCGLWSQINELSGV